MKPIGIFISVFLLFILWIGNVDLVAQESDLNLTKANDEYSKNKFVDAEADYRISHYKSPSNAAAPYNLGNSIYKQNQAAEAKYAYLNSLKNKKLTFSQKHLIYHNLGNALMKERNYAGAVEAYKNALRGNPKDDKTRYNYALAKKLLKDNPPKNDDKNKDKNKDKDKDKDKKDKENKDKEQDKKDENQKDKKDQNNKNNQQNQPKPNPSGIPKERLEDLLNAVNNEEKKVQDKVNAQKTKGKPIDTEKDW